MDVLDCRPPDSLVNSVSPQSLTTISSRRWHAVTGDNANMCGRNCSTACRSVKRRDLRSISKAPPSPS
ncbi:hypothetical protein CEP53_004319 [Fusarium sp. AF-6]|nr:hypothetical protein CEP53_004319 [Fusarium sp. AF-6]